LSGRLLQGENVPGSQRGGGVIQNFLARGNLHRRSAERSRNLPCGANRDDISLHDKRFPCQVRHTDAAKRLQGMHASGGRAEFLHWRQDARILGTARMQNDSAPQFFSTHAGELARQIRNGIIRRSNQDDVGQKNMTRKTAMRLACSEEPNGAP
jgi:hypothetical protein